MAWFGRRPKTTPPTALTTAEVYRPGPLRQPRTGPAFVDAATMVSLPPFWRAMQITSGIMAALPICKPDMVDDIDISPDPDTFFGSPTAHDTWHSFIDSIMWNLLVHGNAFVVPTMVDRMGDISEVEVLRPLYVVPKWSRYETFATEYYIDGETYEPQDIIHFKAQTEGGYAWGLSPLKNLARTIAVQVSEQSHVMSTYEDGAQPTGYLAVRSKMDPDVLKEYAGRVLEQWGGRGNGVAVVDDGAEWKQVTLSHADIQMLESRQWSTTEAAMIMGVPPYLMGASKPSGSDTYANVRQDMEAFQRLTLDRYRHGISQTFRQHGIEFCFRESDLARPDFAARMTAYQQAIASGVLTVDEARAREGLGPAPSQPTPDPVSPEPDGFPPSTTGDLPAEMREQMETA